MDNAWSLARLPKGERVQERYGHMGRDMAEHLLWRVRTDSRLHGAWRLPCDGEGDEHVLAGTEKGNFATVRSELTNWLTRSAR